MVWPLNARNARFSTKLQISLTLARYATRARPPPPPIRYQVYPSVTEERWSVNEILRWYSADRLQRELDALKKLQADAAKKWTDEKWARADSASVSDLFVALPHRLDELRRSPCGYAAGVPGSVLRHQMPLDEHIPCGLLHTSCACRSCTQTA